MICVYKEYEVKIRMIDTGAMTKIKKFLLSYNLKIVS